jgi:hypothetical protein
MQVMAQDKAAKAPEQLLPDGSRYRRTNYMGRGGELHDGPQAFLVEYWPKDGGFVQPHFHHVRQFQVFVRGTHPRLGKHSLEPVAFHYTDADTPYGPIVPDEEGNAWFTLRPAASELTYGMPGSQEQMSRHAGRNIVCNVGRNVLEAAGAEGCTTLIEPSEDGLAAYLLRVGPNEHVSSPSAAGSGGQYHVVCEGALRRAGEELAPLSLVWLADADPLPELTAGDEGAAVLVLQFPVPDQAEELGLAEERAIITAGADAPNLITSRPTT